MEPITTCVIGDVKSSMPLTQELVADFLIEIESVMMKYKVTKLDVCLDTFGLLEQQKMRIINEYNRRNGAGEQPPE